MNPEEALALIEEHVEAGMVADASTLRETVFGFYYHVTSKAYLRTRDMMDMPVGSCGVLVDRNTGEVHDLGSAFEVEYWLEAYDRGLHLSIMETSVCRIRSRISGCGRAVLNCKFDDQPFRCMRSSIRYRPVQGRSKHRCPQR